MKFSLFVCQQTLDLLYHGVIDGLFDNPYLTIFNADHSQEVKQTILSRGHEAGLQTFFNWFERLSDSMTLKAVGHRVVHGGMYFFHPTLITDESMKKIASLIPLAPLHQPHNLEDIKIIKNIYPQLSQVACFHTTFHRTQEKLATSFAILKSLTDEGVFHYGFHDISYEYIASVITQHIGDIGNQRVIVAHLGNGVQVCVKCINVKVLPHPWG